MSAPIELIVGLANPGKEYAETRHNAGAWFVENLAKIANVNLRFEAKYHGLYAKATLDKKTCHLLIPTTFINLSGQAVRACMNFLKIPIEQILIAHDDIDLPTGIARLKFDGGDGGHNGLKDIIRHLNSRQFYRLRIGIDHPGNRDDVVDYVLTKPSKADRQKINVSLEEADNVLPLILAGEMQKAMHQLHSEKR